MGGMKALDESPQKCPDLARFVRRSLEWSLAALGQRVTAPPTRPRPIFKCRHRGPRRPAARPDRQVKWKHVLGQSVIILTSVAGAATGTPAEADINPGPVR